MVRRRQFLVEEVHTPPAPGQATRVCLVCLVECIDGLALRVDRAEVRPVAVGDRLAVVDRGAERPRGVWSGPVSG